MKRCNWVNQSNKLYVDYHDNEWGIASYDDKYLYEMLLLELFQAGLSWECILNKRKNFRKAFDDFDYKKIANYDNNKINELKNNKGIIRNILKIKASINNAKVFINIQKEYGSFANYIWHFTNNIIITNEDDVFKTTSFLSDEVSNDLKRRGMTFVGSTIIYSYLQAIGIINDHELDCSFYGSKIDIDLHIHTNNSDGSLTPYEVIDEAKKNGIKTISITDHDTLDSYTKDVIKYAKENGIKLIHGVEISTIHDNNKFHLLGYDVDITNIKLLKELNNLKNARYIYLKEVSKKLTEYGYEVNLDKLLSVKSVTKAHIANDIIENKNNSGMLLKDFDHIPSVGEFIETIMNKDCPCYVKKNTITPKEASKLIKDAGGKVILAHPVAYEYENSMTKEEILKVALDIKADGLESIYLYIDKNNNLINEIKEWVKIAKDNNLITTVGSDFHKFDIIKPHIGFNNYNSIKKELLLIVVF